VNAKKIDLTLVTSNSGAFHKRSIPQNGSGLTEGGRELN